VYRRPKDPSSAKGSQPNAAKVGICEEPLSKSPGAVHPDLLFWLMAPELMRVALQRGSGSQAPAPTKPAADFIFATSVPGLFFLNATTGAYEPKSSGAIGCVVVGAALSYNLMFYDSTKAQLSITPITPSVRFLHIMRP
jgi:hypothetical protein